MYKLIKPTKNSLFFSCVSFCLKGNKKSTVGFTLIELLVVIIIIGVLSAVALPNLLGQVGKARETEAKNAMGTIIRSQQAYHYEKGTFTAVTNAELASNNPLGVNISSEYYSFIAGSPGLDTHVNIQANPTDGLNDGVRTFAGGLVYENGQYDTAICISGAINGSQSTSGDGNVAGAAQSGPDYYCANGSEIR